MPISATNAWQEAAATNDAAVVPLVTLEINHPAFIENGQRVSVRVVRNTTQIRARLEANAPFNGGALVTFTAMPFEIEMPRISEIGAEAPLRVENINRRIQRYLKEAATMNQPISVIFRGYVDTDLETVAHGPYQLFLKRAVATGSTLEGGLVVADPRSLRVLNSVYDMVRFPALMDALT